MQKDRKPLEWIGAAWRELKNFPALARRAAGANLFLVQKGQDPGDWKPMEQVGPGARELRIQTFEGGSVQHRVVYVAKFPEAVYVLHAFEKKTQKTPQLNLQVAKARYREMVRDRADGTGKQKG
ncbi:MAG TPA: type II toxin-antitoxin system RelE/ParE family toxin [Longimicrobium sp.]|nr:type II toxin-antitoxin system RelE/ParE family toxin [Longimicrobium sp.]